MCAILFRLPGFAHFAHAVASSLSMANGTKLKKMNHYENLLLLPQNFNP